MHLTRFYIKTHTLVAYNFIINKAFHDHFLNNQLVKIIKTTKDEEKKITSLVATKIYNISFQTKNKINKFDCKL